MDYFANLPKTEAMEVCEIETGVLTSVVEEESGTKLFTVADACVSYWPDQLPGNMMLNDGKSLLRFIIQPVKVIINALNDQNLQNVQTLYNETELLSKFFVLGLSCLDIFTFGNSGSSFQKPINSYGIRSKEEKEVIDAFYSIVSFFFDFDF